MLIYFIALITSLTPSTVFTNTFLTLLTAVSLTSPALLSVSSTAVLVTLATSLPASLPTSCTTPIAPLTVEAAACPTFWPASLAVFTKTETI